MESAQQPISRLLSFSAQDLRRVNPKPPEFVVSNLAPVGLITFAAPPKSGKSWFCLALADAVAEGLDFMGFTTKRGPVLYLALEDSQYRLNERLRSIGSRFPDSLFLVVKKAESIGTGLLWQLEMWFADHPGTKLVIIDTIGRIKGGGIRGLNAYEQDVQIFAAVQAFAIDHSVCIVCVTHYSKTKTFGSDDPFERISGSVGLFADSDAGWILSRKRGEETSILRVTGRDINDASFKLRFSNGLWTMEGESEAIARQQAISTYRLSPLMRTIVALVKKNERWQGTARELLAEVLKRGEGCDVSSAQETGKKIADNKALLHEIDGIDYIHSPGGRQGRGYVFLRTDQPKM